MMTMLGSPTGVISSAKMAAIASARPLSGLVLQIWSGRTAILMSTGVIVPSVHSTLPSGAGARSRTSAAEARDCELPGSLAMYPPSVASISGHVPVAVALSKIARSLARSHLSLWVAIAACRVSFHGSEIGSPSMIPTGSVFRSRHAVMSSFHRHSQNVQGSATSVAISFKAVSVARARRAGAIPFFLLQFEGSDPVRCFREVDSVPFLCGVVVWIVEIILWPAHNRLGYHLMFGSSSA
jgi:hypothetical protein